MQGLLNWLPADPAAPPLPAYSATPKALDPLHCRLCLAHCYGVLPASEDPPGPTHDSNLVEPGEEQAPSEDGSELPAEVEEPDAAMDVQVAPVHPRSRRYATGVDPRVAAHLAAAHPGVSVEDYRRRVLGDAVARWPEAVPAQALRTRLAAYADAHALMLMLMPMLMLMRSCSCSCSCAHAHAHALMLMRSCSCLS